MKNENNKRDFVYPANFDIKKNKSKDIINLKLRWYEKLIKFFIGKRKVNSVAVSDLYDYWRKGKIKNIHNDVKKFLKKIDKAEKNSLKHKNKEFYCYCRFKNGSKKE